MGEGMKLLTKIQKEINQACGHGIECREWRASIVLEGAVPDWDTLVSAGLLAANRGYRGVVNRLTVPGLPIPEIRTPRLQDNALDGRRCDVLIIGGGVIGCAIARELSQYDISIVLIDKEDDLSMHASSRNDGMVHPGIEPKPSSLKALYNVRGNAMYGKLAAELDFPFRRTGSIILFEKRWLRALVPVFTHRAARNGVPGVRFIPVKEIKEREPYVTGEIAGGLFIPSTGFVSPYKTTIAFAENAVANGAVVSLNTVARSMQCDHGRIISVATNRGTVYPRAVVNAAGCYADAIADMAGDQFFTIHPRKGHLAFLDKKKGYLVHSVVARPDLATVHSHTKGGGVVRTIDGNILVGPDAIEQPCREDFTTDRASLKAILDKHLPLIPALSPADVITYCAGVRAATYEEDFIVEKSEYVSNLIHAAGIQSPGLASAPAIAQEIERITVEILGTEMRILRKSHWNPTRKGIPDLSKLSEEERNAYIRLRPSYGRIVCRCEEISEGEIIDALRSPIPVSTVDGVKRRVRAGMGRCQGGFCLPLVCRIIHEETGLSLEYITKKGRGSFLLSEETKRPQPGLLPETARPETVAAAKEGDDGAV